MAVTIVLENGELGGLIQTADGVCGIVMHGNSEMGGYTIGTPIVVFSMQDIATAGITAGNNPFAFNQLQNFYNKAGAGAKLYIMLLPYTMTIADFCDNTNSASAKVLLNYAHGAIKVLGVMSDDLGYASYNEVSYPSDTSVGFNTDVATASVNMQTMAAVFFAIEMPFRCILAGTSFQRNIGELVNWTTEGNTNNRTGILIGDIVETGYTNDGYACCMGLLLATVSVLPVERKISRVRNGGLPVTDVTLGSMTYEAWGWANVAALPPLGYITFQTFPNFAGFYFSGDPMLTQSTDDYSSLARGRVIDKAHVIAYQTFTNEVDDEIPINTDGSGTMVSTFIAFLQQLILDQINGSMVAQKNCSGVICYINPAQDVVTANTVNIVLKVVPVAYATNLVVDLGFGV